MVIRSIIYILLFGFIGVQEIQSQSVNLIFKVKEEHRLKCRKNKIDLESIERISQKHGLNYEKIFPEHQALNQKSLDQGWVDISTIYRINLADEAMANEVLRELKKDRTIKYAEREVVNQLTYQPNDTLIYLQWYLDAVRAFDAWDIEQGDTSVFIAITDTGTDTDHPDLADNLYKNWDDPINGMDDDGDGYIDNFYGWDVAMNDNDVNPETHAGSSHGTNVAGIASATTDNTTMVAGCGFNTRIMTLKLDNPVGQLIAAYDGVVYAADRGAPIINCSWGSYNYSEFGQDIVNYAAINQGALIICGAGNGPFGGPGAGTGIENRFYPAAYENAMAIGAIDTGDIVKLSSNYGYWLDLFAPGERMWTTTGGGNYGRNGGTSMAAPVVAAAAALIKAQNPSFDRRQIEERLINSAINIDAANDPKYQGKLGPGKVDFLNALADTNKAGIRFENISYSNNENDIILSGDSLFISGEFINHLKASAAGTATLTELSSSLTAVKSQINLPALSTKALYDNSADPFIFLVDPQINLNERVEFKLEVNIGNYSRVQHFSTLINIDNLNIGNDKIDLTLGSNGSIGFTGPSRSLGLGFSYLGGSSQLYEASFLIGNGINYVADAFRGVGGFDDDFNLISLVREFSSPMATAAANTVFNDGGISSPTLFDIAQNTYLYDSAYSENAVIFNYVIKNISGNQQSNLYAGMIADWDIINFANNRVFYDTAYQMGVSFSTDSSLYFGMTVISHPELMRHYAIDNDGNGQGGVNVSGGFTTEEKFQVLSNQRDSAGFHNNNGEDIIDAVSIGPFDLPADSSISLTYAWLVGNSLAELREAADSAKAIFEKLPIGLKESQRNYSNYKIYPNPAHDQLNIEINDLRDQNIAIEVYDLKGQRVMLKSLRILDTSYQFLSLDLSSLKTGVYLLRILGDKTNIQDKFVVSPNY